MKTMFTAQMPTLYLDDHRLRLAGRLHGQMMGGYQVLYPNILSKYSSYDSSETTLSILRLQQYARLSSTAMSTSSKGSAGAGASDALRSDSRVSAYVRLGHPSSGLI